jgi:hypothetical protein
MLLIMENFMSRSHARYFTPRKRMFVMTCSIAMTLAFGAMAQTPDEAALQDVARYAAAYEAAVALGTADATREPGLTYHQQMLLPAFTKRFSPVLKDCINRTGYVAQGTLSFVATVNASGEIDDVLWKTRSSLSTCFDYFLRKGMFPKPPTAPFHFAVSINVHS